MPSELLGCPFCGSRNVAQGASSDRISVWCFCGARGPDIPFPEHCDPVPQIQKCYEAWNRRALASVVEAESVQFAEGSDWDAAAHVRLLRQQGGASSGYTADLIEKLHRALAQSPTVGEITDEMVERILRKHIKVDATGMAPVVASAYVIGFKEAAAAIAALSAASLTRLPDAGWRPIETAPQDGTHILVCFGPYDQWTTFRQRPPTVAHWFGPPEAPGLRAGGWYPSVQTNDSNTRLHPMHWMPLPDAPPDTGRK